MKRLFFSLAILAIFGVLASCTPAATIVKVEIVSAPDEVEVGNLVLSEFQIKISYSDDTFKFANLEVKMFSDLEYAKFNEVGDQTIAFTYNGIPGVISITIIDPNLVTYTVVFKSGDEVLKTEEVEEGASATAPANPTKVGHTFKEWDKAFTNVTSNLEVNAVFDVNTYTVTFKNGTETITTVTVNHGESATAPANPTKVGHTFKEWDKAFTNVTSNLEVNAVFDVNTYTVTFKNGTETITTVTVNHGESATAPANPTKVGHTFKEWDKAFTNVTSNLEVNAVFDVNTYTVTFKNGTETITTVTVNHGESATAPANPTKVGHTFKEWDKAFTNVTSNLEVNAVFDVNTYTVTFKNGTETITTVTVNHGESATAPANPTKVGHTFKEWDKVFTNVTSNLEVNAVFDVNTYTVTFKNGTETITTVTVNHGESATAPANPTKVGHTFKEWDKVFTNVTSNLEVNAVFDILTYTVTFKNGTETITTVTVNHGESATAPANPTKVGHTFKEWDKAFTNVTSNLEVNAVFDVNTYTVTFKNGTETITTVTVNHGESATAPANPTKVGHTFKEWDKAFTNVTSNLEVNAVFDVNTYTVTFKNGTETITTVTVNHGESATAPANPTKVGHTFKEWDKVFTNVTSNLEVNAVFDVNTYTVTFKNGTETITTVTVNHGESATAPANPTKVGHTFKEWDKVFTNVTSNLEVNAVFDILTYTVTFKNGTETITTVTVNHGESATAPANPTKVGHTFKEWDKAFTNVTSNLEVNAVFDVNTYTVTFKNGTETITTVTVNHGESATAPANPTKVGHTFKEWDKVFTNVTSNLEVNAVFDILTYTVTFKNGTESITTVTVNHGESATAPANPTKVGHTFKEWDKAFTNVTSNLEVNAVFDILTYTVTFKNGTETITTVTVNHGESATAPANPTKVGHTFKEWDKAFTNVTSNLEVNAVFEQDSVVNQITISSHEATPNDTISVTVSISGEVNFASYDIRLLYDATKLQYISYSSGMHMQLFNKVADGELAFNYAGIANITNAETLITINFKVLADVTTSTSITFKEVAIAYLTNIYEVIETEFFGVEGNISIDASPIVLDEFTVRFFVDGVLIKEEQVLEGSNATEPSTPTKEGFIFINWDKSFMNVQSNLDINAIFEEESQTTNIIFIESKDVSIGEAFTVNIEIKGNVYFSSYDIRIIYDSTTLQLDSYTKGVYVDLVNTSMLNEIRFNYVSITNKTEDALLLTLQFTALGALPAEIIISPYYIDISTVSPNYEVLPVNFKVLNGYINIHDIK